MPRKGPVPRREILPDPIFNSKLVTRFVNRLMYDGKKGPAESIFYNAINSLAEKTGEEAIKAFEKAIENVDRQEAEKMAAKMMKGKFDLEDMLSQLRQVQKLGSLGNIIGMLPGVSKFKNQIEQAGVGDNLIKKLEGNPSFIFTLIQKFNRKVEKPIIPDHDIIIMSDEAHRSQYGIFADNMADLLPTASKIGFTGTPLLSNDNITDRTFGGYISIYDFKRAVEDRATVPLYYENRGERILDIHNPNITDRILDAMEAADLDAEQSEKMERKKKKEIHVLYRRFKQNMMPRVNNNEVLGFFKRI